MRQVSKLILKSSSEGAIREPLPGWFVTPIRERDLTAGKIKPTVLNNLQKFSGVKPEDVPPQIPL